MPAASGGIVPDVRSQSVRNSDARASSVAAADERPSDHTRCSMVARSGEIHRNSFADQPTLASSCTCSDIEFLSYSRRRRRRKRARRRRRHGSREWSRRTLNAARTCAFALRQCGLDGYPYITARAGRSGKLLYLTVLPTARRRRSRRHWRCKRRGWRKNIFVGTHARTHACVHRALLRTARSTEDPRVRSFGDHGLVSTNRWRP
jgi:hypothetical protein